LWDLVLQAINEVAQDNLELGNIDNGISLKVFVSTSMSVSLLKNYGDMAKKYGAVLVLNGLPEGSWSSLSNLIYELNRDKQEDDHISLQIDDTAFDEYGITRVPTIVLAKEKSIFEDDNNKEAVFDKIAGNIGIRRALEEFAAKGRLQEEATGILEQSGR